MRRIAFFVMIAGVVACSAFVSLDGLRVPDEAGVDGSSSADVVDASAMPDSPVPDGGPDVYRFPCPDASIICDNFDDTPLGAKWSRSTVTNGMLALDSDGSVSMPSSLLVTLVDNPNYDDRQARLEKDISNVKSLDCEFAFRVDATTATADEDVEPLGLELNVNGYVDYQMWINITSTDLGFEQTADNGGEAGASGRVESIIGGLMTGVWRHVRFTTDFQRAQFAVDGTPVYDKPLMVPIAQATGKLHVGLVYDAEPPSWTYRIDDVLCK